jgi:hypothetical protein
MALISTRFARFAVPTLGTDARECASGNVASVRIGVSAGSAILAWCRSTLICINITARAFKAQRTLASVTVWTVRVGPGPTERVCRSGWQRARTVYTLCLGCLRRTRNAVNSAIILRRLAVQAEEGRLMS